MKYRDENDSLGTVSVPDDALWGAQTQRASENFPHQGDAMPQLVIEALASIKKAAAIANERLGQLDDRQKALIVQACDEVLSGQHDGQFPLSIWQSGSGTQSNMNMNEVIANRANELAGGKRGSKYPVHPNDHVNCSQSSNDVFPTAMHLSALWAVERSLIPALNELRDALQRKSDEFQALWKVGRTHLMDAAPMTLGQEFSGYVAQIDGAIKQLEEAREGLYPLAIGGTAVGSGLNTPQGWQCTVIEQLQLLTGLPVSSGNNKFAALSSHGPLLALSAALRQLAAEILVIGNNLRMLASGPRAGLGEVQLPANEPGSSIMPGKVNPTQIESITMIAVQVMGLDSAVNLACTQAHLQLNVFKPLIISNVLEAIDLLTAGSQHFVRHCVNDLSCHEKQLAKNVEHSLMIVTALTPMLGYDKAAEIAKYAQANDLTIRQVLEAQKILSGAEFDRLIRQHVLGGG
ncbi:MAG: class II fumarate hydratase [Gammaproteobacteria bacterium]|nr:MAG: class II fumarate hydratase [Gammaproteobacteria bacterium]